MRHERITKFLQHFALSRKGGESEIDNISGLVKLCRELEVIKETIGSTDELIKANPKISTLSLWNQLITHAKLLEDQADLLRNPQNGWKPITTSPWGREVMVSGDSGYGAPHDKFYINAYREKDWHGGSWNDATGTRLSENGWVPIMWKEIT